MRESSLKVGKGEVGVMNVNGEDRHHLLESEAEKKAEEAKKSEAKANPWKIFTPMNFRIIG